MKKYFFISLLFGLTVLSPCFVAFGDGGKVVWHEAVSENGTKGKATPLNNDSGSKSIAGGCNKTQIGKKCSKTGVREGICINVAKESEPIKPSCAARICDTGYLLELYSNGKSKGICRTEQFAKDQCKSVLKKLGETCDDGQEAVPMLVKNPNDSSDTRAYKECFCANKNMVIYKCGEGASGTPPTDSTTYTNMQDVIIKESTGCTKTGSTFTKWRCGNTMYDPGAIINIENGITCVAQWDTNKYTVTFDWGDDSGAETKEIKYGESVKLPDVADASNHSKKEHTFKGWMKGEQLFNPGASVKVEDDAKYIAQWEECTKCTPGSGCTCKIDVESNKCKYITTPQNGYIITSGENTKSPQCILASEQECTDSDGQWLEGECKCKPDVTGAHWDITNRKCVCDDAGKVIENGQCIEPTKCPKDASGTYPKCTCNNTDKEYKSANNTCECPPDKPQYVGGKCITVGEQECTDSGGQWLGGECKCKPNVDGAHWDIRNSKCVCDDVGKEYEESTHQCIVPTKCPDDATGNYSDCKCDDPEKTYNKVKNICECPLDKPDDGNGNCVAPKQCPSDATGQYPKCRCNDADKKYDRNKNECVIDELKKAYDDAKAKEQSLENRMLTATTVAATGIGGMELARGFSEQQADQAATADMLGYVSTFRCEYGNGNNVVGGPEEIQLPVIDLTANKTKYKELAASIKVRKEALGMKPGLESEEILEKTTLYDEENTGITGSSLDEGSIYRAEILGIANDQEKIKSSSEASERRVKGGATSLGGGIVGGITGNSAINGKIGEKIKEIKNKKSDKK